jgi:small-conductance mechanosensitive channel
MNETTQAPETETNNSALTEVLPINDLRQFLETAVAWAQTNILTIDVGIQMGLIIAALVPGAIFGPRLAKLIANQLAARTPYGVLKRAARALGVLATPIALYLTLHIFRIALGSAARPTAWIDGAISLLTAWILVRLVTLVIQSAFWSRIAFYVVWPIAALDAFGGLDDVIVQLQRLSIPLGTDNAGNEVDISLFDVIRTLIYFGVLFWAASALGKFLETRIEKIDELTPALKALIVKILNVVLPVIALLIALQIVGFNLATLAIFGGAVGLGVGLGLQRIIANFVAGFTLIADRSIKPRDVIEINDTFGWVTEMQARYVAIRTRDGTEHLIPNDNFMSEGVINWSRSDRVVRMHAPFGVSYGTQDLRTVQQLAIDAAKSIERVVASPAPSCNLMGFGDSSIDFDLRFWIRDPANGKANVRSDVFLEIWDRLKENGIEVPFPQRDLHVKSWDVESVVPPPKDA